MKKDKRMLPLLFLPLVLLSAQTEKKNSTPPNILILMSDNQSWNHLGCYGDAVIKTPHIDKMAANGIRFTNAYCSCPSCAPARASMLTGKDIWNLEEAANLWGDFPQSLTPFPQLLEKAGYLVGIEGKGWGPGNFEASGWKNNPGGRTYSSFEEFYNQRKRGQPFFFWFSSRDPHRPYNTETWKKEGIDPDKIIIPPYLPDSKEVREDIASYYAEIQNFDTDVASFVHLMNEIGQLDNTFIIVCSDNGWQMPRGLANLYDFGMRVPLIIYMPKRFAGNRVVNDFVSLNDFAPTILELAGLPIPKDITAKSLFSLLESDKQGVIDQSRDCFIGGRERHAFARQGGAGYPGRSIRTKDFLYIRNYEPDQWPAGDPPLYGDIDAHMMHYNSPTKEYMMKNAEKDSVKELFQLGFGKRPNEELFDLKKDPYQMVNVAQNPEYMEQKEMLVNRLNNYLKKTKDPRVTGGEMKWINAPYYMEGDKKPTPGKSAIEEFHLKSQYNYLEKE
jgi:arylsulfatase A-like enzyme